MAGDMLASVCKRRNSGICKKHFLVDDWTVCDVFKALEEVRAEIKAC